jgi:ACS family glucarate transporter-like MFS transporter
MNNRATNVRWRILAILIFVSFISYVLRSNISIAAPAMIADLGLTEIQWGWVLAAFTTGYALFQIPGGIIGDRFGPRKALTAIAILWGLLTIATGLIPDSSAASAGFILASLITVRFLIGMVHAPVFPVINCSIERWFPVGGWAFPTGLSSTGLTLGFAAAAPVLVWMIAQWGWRTAFLVLSPLGFISALLWWWYSRDRPGQHPSVNAIELAQIRAGRSFDPENPADPDPQPIDDDISWKQLLKNRDILLLTISYGCMNFVFYDAFNWFFYYLVTVRDFAASDAGIMTSSQWIAGAVGAAAGGWMCDRLCKRFGLRWGCRSIVVFGMAISGVLLIIGSVTGSAYLAVTMLALCFFFNQLTEGAYWATSMAIGRRYAGTAGGVMNTGGNLMGILNSVLVPAVSAWLGWTFAMALGGVFALVGAALMLLVRVERPFYADEVKV